MGITIKDTVKIWIIKMVINYAKCMYCMILYIINLSKTFFVFTRLCKTRYFLLIFMCVGFMYPAYAELNSGMIFQVPSAALSQTPLIEGGMITSIGYHESNIKFIGQGFLKAHLTPRVGIQGVMHHEFSSLGVHVVIHKFTDYKTKATHYFGAGSLYSNMTTIPASYPLVNSYLNYSLEFLGSRAHLGVGSNAMKKPAFVSFLGLEVELSRGYTFLEFLGTIFNIGYAHKLKDNMQGLFIFTPNFNEDPSLEAMVINFGVRVVDPFEYVHQREKEQLVDLIEEKNEVKEEREELSTQSLSDAIDSIKASDDYVRSGQFELARDEIMGVIEIFPTAKNYSKLGSIFYRLGNMDEAIYHWDKALEIDPYNKKLKKFVDQVKLKQGYNIEDETQEDQNQSIQSQESTTEQPKTVKSDDFVNVPIPEDSQESKEVTEESEQVTQETEEETKEEVPEETNEEESEDANNE